MKGEWAHVYAALLQVRTLLESNAPETVRKLTSVQAFRDVSTLPSLLAKLPDVPRTEPVPIEPKQTILGVDLSRAALQADFLAGSSGALGKRIFEAAKIPLDPAILAGVRAQLPSPPSSSSLGDGGHGGSRCTGGLPRREAELVGDIGEAFVHEWLSLVPGVDYAPDCWVSKARERYGLPAVGNDDLGYDFKVSDPEGRLFQKPLPNLLIEVKATSTDGIGPFPMSSKEWEVARQCHEGDGSTTYVIIRVFNTIEHPRIGDVLIDPFDAYRRGEVRYTDRDLWITVAPLVSSSEET